MSFGITAETGNNIQTDGLVFYFDAAYKKSYPGSGTAVIDLVSGTEGALTNGPTFNSSGYFDFDGSNDYLDMGFTPTNAICSSGFTWGYWFNWDSISGNKHQGIIDGGNGRIYMGPYDNNLIVGCGNQYELDCGALSTGTWMYCVMAFDGSSTCRAYINGSLSETISSVTFSLTGGSGTMLWAATNNDTSLGYYNNGKGALTHFYSKELSAGDILQNYNAQKERFGG